MEEDEETTKIIPPWVELEYAVGTTQSVFIVDLKFSTQHMRILAGEDAKIHFTHLSQSSSDSLTKIFGQASNDHGLAQASCYNIGVLNLMKELSVPLEKVCLLDPKAEVQLSPQDGDGRFTWFLFGVRMSYFYLSLAKPQLTNGLFEQGILGSSF